MFFSVKYSQVNRFEVRIIFPCAAKWPKDVEISPKSSRSLGVGEPHDDDVDELAVLVEVGPEAVLGGAVIEAAKEQLARGLGVREVVAAVTVIVVRHFFVSFNSPKNPEKFSKQNQAENR